MSENQNEEVKALKEDLAKLQKENEALTKQVADLKTETEKNNALLKEMADEIEQKDAASAKQPQPTFTFEKKTIRLMAKSSSYKGQKITLEYLKANPSVTKELLEKKSGILKVEN